MILRDLSALRLILACFLQVLVFHPGNAIADAGTAQGGGGCAIDSVLVTQPLCEGECTGSLAVFAHGTGPMNYQWSGMPGVDTPAVSGLCAGWYTVVITDSTGCVVYDTIAVDDPPGIDYQMVTVDATCPGGCSGSVTVTGLDSVAHTFQWLGYVPTGPYLGSLCQGTYAVVITNSQGCSVVASAEVGYDPPFDLSFVTTPASCINSCDGTATVFANGIPPFSYQWGTGPIQSTQGALNLCSGSYIVNVSDSTGCVVTDSVGIPTDTPPAITFSQSTPTCYGGCNGTAQVQVSGNGQYAYEWNTFPQQDSVSATGLCAGTYLVQIADNASGCVFVDSVVVENPQPPSITFTTTPSFCDNFCSGSATVSASGTGPVTYEWQTGASTQTAFPLCPGIYSVTITDSLGCSTSASVTVPSQELLFTITDAHCDSICDAAVEVMLPGGTGWQVTWYTNPVQHTSLITNVCPGTYQLALLDTAGCQVSAVATVGAQQPIAFNTTVVPVSCPGSCDGSIQATVSGYAPFLIDWLNLPGNNNDSIFQLCAGIYPVLITDSLGCTLSDTLTVPGAATPEFIIDSIPNSCFGICDAASVINPVIPGAYTYTWQTVPLQYGNTATGLCEGWAIVEVTDSSGCATRDSILILGPAAIDISFSTTSPSCPGNCDGFASSQVFGGTPGFSYFWSNGYLVPQVLNLCEGTYMLTVIDSEGCIETDSVILTDPDPISLSLSVTDASCASCADGTITAAVTGGTPSYHFVWIPGGVGGPVLNNVPPGNYMLCVSDYNSCAACDSVLVSFTSMTQEIPQSHRALQLFPNPCSEFVTIKMNDVAYGNGNNFTLNGYDVLGRKIYGLDIKRIEYESGNLLLTLETEYLNEGIYLLTLMDPAYEIYTGILNVQH